MKTAELTGAELDRWVAKAKGEPFGAAYSSDWSHGGPIIERERIAVLRLAVSGDGATYTAEWCAFRQGDYTPTYFDVQADEAEWRGSTAMIAAMRAFVASKFGPEVSE